MKKNKLLIAKITGILAIATLLILFFRNEKTSPLEVSQNPSTKSQPIKTQDIGKTLDPHSTHHGATKAGHAPAPINASQTERFRIVQNGEAQLMLDTQTGKLWHIDKTPTGQMETRMILDPRAKTKEDEIQATRQQHISRARYFVNKEAPSALEQYYKDIGTYPNRLTQLNANLEQNPNWQGPYLQRSPIDPWGRLYRYRYPSKESKQAYDLWSVGRDGVLGEGDPSNW